MANVAIITARGGSKRIPRKNIKEFMGKPMLAYAIEAAQKSEIFDEVMVSTDDNEIKEIALKYGANIPFMRSIETSNDFATTNDVLNEVINEYKKRDIEFEKFACIYPCVPFLNAEILKNAYENFLNSNADSLMPVVKYSFPIQRAVKINKEGYLEYREPQYALSRSQDLEPMFHDVGMFYFSKTNTFIKNKTLLTSKTTFFEMDERVIQDIDTLDDWQMAEMKYKVMYGV